MIRSFRRIWAQRLIGSHREAVDNYILKAIDEKDPWLINLLFTIDPTGNVPLYKIFYNCICCLLYTSPSPRDRTRSRMPSSA